MASRTMFGYVGTEESQSSIRTTRSRTSLANMANNNAGTASIRRPLIQPHRVDSHETTTITNGTRNRSIRSPSIRASTHPSINIPTSIPNNTRQRAIRGRPLAVRTLSHRLRQSTVVDTQHQKKAFAVQPTSVGLKVPQHTPPKLVNTNCSQNMINVYYCPICFTNVRKQDGISLIGTDCGHLFCEECILQAIEKRPKCPLCLRSLTKDQLREFYL